MVGEAQVTLSFESWKGVKVASTRHIVPVLPPKGSAPTEPAAPNLVGSLVHPERTGNVKVLQFSPDGARLFCSGIPSGIVQIFDVAARKELVRIDTPAGYKPDHYALLAPDWKTIYVPVQRYKIEKIERDGERIRRMNYSGTIRVFDASTGVERASMNPSPECAPVSAVIAPDGKFLSCVERPSQDWGKGEAKDQTVLWNLSTGKKTKLWEGPRTFFARPNFLFLPNDRILIAAGLSELELRGRDSGKVFAKWTCPDTDRVLSLHNPSPDRKLVSVALGGKANAPLEYVFLDAETLEERGRLVGKGSPYSTGWGPGEFTPDGKNFAAVDASGEFLLWSPASRRIERRFSVSAVKTDWYLAISPDSKTAAVAWLPTTDELDEGDDPDDFPQPRVSVLDLTGATPTRVLIAPSRGYVGGVAFSPDGRMVALGCTGRVHLFDLTK